MNGAPGHFLVRLSHGSHLTGRVGSRWGHGISYQQQQRPVRCRQDKERGHVVCGTRSLSIKGESSSRSCGVHSSVWNTALPGLEKWSCAVDPGSQGRCAGGGSPQVSKHMDWGVSKNGASPELSGSLGVHYGSAEKQSHGLCWNACVRARVYMHKRECDIDLLEGHGSHNYGGRQVPTFAG